MLAVVCASEQSSDNHNCVSSAPILMIALRRIMKTLISSQHLFQHNELAGNVA